MTQCLIQYLFYCTLKLWKIFYNLLAYFQVCFKLKKKKKKQDQPLDMRRFVGNKGSDFLYEASLPIQENMIDKSEGK